MTRKKMSPQKRKRFALLLTFLVFSLSVLLPLGSYTLHWMGSTAVAQEQAAVNPRSNYWRAVRDGVEGYSSVKGDGANVLVQSNGNEWRNFRNGPLTKILPWLIVGMLGLLFLYHLFRCRNRLDVRPQGRKVKRWNGFERLVHWVTAISFIALAVTGLSMLVGKEMLAYFPDMKAGFAAWAGLSIQIHNLVGPVFSVGILIMIIMWIGHNMPTTVDLDWLAAGGGMFKRNHPSADRMNAGEKIWFWILATVGVAVCLTGIVMVAPLFGWFLPDYLVGREVMQQATIIHAVLAIIWTAVALGHIYIGTAGTEGAFEGMATGYVSEEWARQHHDIWYDKVSGEINHRVAAERAAERAAAERGHTRVDVDLQHRAGT